MVDLMDLLQPGDNGFICQINEGDNNNISFYDSPSNELFAEIEKLKLIISHQKELILHKDQMLQQKTDENVLLKELVSNLRSKSIRMPSERKTAGSRLAVFFIE